MGLSEDVKEIKEELKQIKGEEAVKKPKGFKIPFFKRVRNKEAKKNFVTILKVNENGHADFVKEPISEQTVMIDEVPRLATAEHIINIGKNPIMVIPSWSVQPINWKTNHETSLDDGSNIAGYKLLLNRMKLSTVESQKKGMPPFVLWIIGILIVGGIAYALFTGKI
jgi:hypothetical protein